MSEQPQDPAGGGGVGAKLARFANWLNETVVGSPWALVTAIVLVVGADLLIPIQGFSKWNVTTGLFFNTQSSNFELITGFASVCAVVSVHRGLREDRKERAHHRAELAALRKMVGDALHHRQAPASMEKVLGKSTDSGSGER